MPLRLFTQRDVIHKGTGRDASSSPSSSSSVCTAISPRNTCRCFASFPKTSDSQANRFSKQTRERLVAGWSQLPGCLPVSGDRREIGCEAERRSCINTDQRTTARLPASAITYSRGEGHSQPLADYIDHRGQNHNLIHLSPHLKISPCPGDLSVLINGPRWRSINVRIRDARSSKWSPSYNFIGIMSAAFLPHYLWPRINQIQCAQLIW